MPRISALVLLTFAVLIGSVGCSETKTFKVVFANLLPAGHNIECYMNGNTLGTVSPGATAEFSADTRRSATSPSSPDHSEATVVFTARDLSTGVLSHAFEAKISTDQTTYVEVTGSWF